MAPKKDIVYSKGLFMSMEPSRQLIGSSDDERDLEYVPPGNNTLIKPPVVTRCTPKKVVPGEVTASQYNEERIFTSTLSGSVSGS